MLLTHHSLLTVLASSAFDPLSINWDYYNQNTIAFNGTNYINSGIYNAYAIKDFWHIWFKSTITDGQPAAINIFWGGRDSSFATAVQSGILTTGVIRVSDGNILRTSVSPFLFANGAIAATVFHIYRDNVNIKVDIDGVNWLTSSDLTKPTTQSTRTIYYGANNANGTINVPWIGTSSGIYVIGLNADLTAQQISDMNTYMTNL